MTSRRVIDALWLTSGPAGRVLALLNGDGEEARAVGGAVRNALMGLDVGEIDIATTAVPDEVVRRAKVAGIKSVPTGIEHGTVTLVVEGTPVEVTTLREDVETFGRKAKVMFGRDWQRDAERRDFTMNGLSASIDGVVHDHVGGIADVDAKRVRFIGDPDRRIAEDYLRILRFFRFYAWYGRGAPDADGLAACAALKAGMALLSAERVSKELLKLLAAPDPKPSVRAMSESGVLAQVLPQVQPLELFEAMWGLTEDPVLRLSALLPADAAAVVGIAGALRLSNGVRDRLAAVVAEGPVVTAAMPEAEARAAIYRLGRGVFEDRLTRAEAGGSGDGAALRRLAATWTPPRMPVGGRDLARLGLKPGPETGRILKTFENGWIANDFPTDGHEARLAALISSRE